MPRYRPRPRAALTKEQADRGASAEGVLRLLDQVHCDEGWLHRLTRRAGQPV